MCVVISCSRIACVPVANVFFCGNRGDGGYWLWLVTSSFPEFQRHPGLPPMLCHCVNLTFNGKGSWSCLGRCREVTPRSFRKGSHIYSLTLGSRASVGQALSRALCDSMHFQPFPLFPGGFLHVPSSAANCCRPWSLLLLFNLFLPRAVRACCCGRTPSSLAPSEQPH